MKHTIVFLFCIFVFLFQSCQESSTKERPKVIFDTDIGGDIDDLGALYALHVFADRGLCDIIGVMSSWSMAYHVNGIDAVNTYFGRPDIPIGAYDGDFFEKKEYTWFLGQHFPSDQTGYTAPKTTPLYRKLLANSKDNSITIIVTGRPNNIYNLMHSHADQYSALNGLQLINKKVKKMYAMGGSYDNESRGEANFFWAGKGVAKYVIDLFPKPIVFNGSEIGLAEKGYGTGQHINQLNDDNILKAGYQYFFANPPEWTKMPSSDSIKNWSIWDIITVQVAITGTKNYFDIVTKGHNEIDHLGHNKWVNAPDKSHAYLVPKMPPQQYANSIIEPILLTEAHNKQQ